MTSERVARRAGELRYQSRRTDTVDAIVVATADLVGGRAVLTTDPDDCRVLAAPTDVQVVSA